MPAGSHRFEIGTIGCTVLSDGYAAYPTPWFFPDADPEELSRALECRRAPQETVLCPYTCLLVETGRQVMLVDTGLGAASPTSGAILARLEMAGIRPKDVDTVVLTHAHPDHIGGAVDLSQPKIPRPTFPNARYVISELEWEFWMEGHAGRGCLRLPAELQAGMVTTARRSLTALRHQVEMVEGETEVTPGVRVIPAPGHTPGHMAVLLGSEGHQLLNVGDAAVHPLHLEHPDWENGFDQEGGQAVETRRALLERAAAANMYVMAFHFPFPSVGRVVARAEGGWEWRPGAG
jgi:glyoxylase-like metal-dependent hydrolase (beta-lactamase superfamily II)